MLLDTVTLENFRTYTKQRITFSPTITCFVGPNTIGKTNIIEAIFALSSGKSFRAGKDREMIMWEKELLRIKATTNEDTLELMITPGLIGNQKAPLKRHLVNGVPRRSIDFSGKLKAVLFAPEDLELVTGSPSIRRKFLDVVLSQIDREYRRSVLSYEKGIRQRNKILFQIHEGLSSRGQLFFWDQLLIKAGGYITDARLMFIDYINSYQLPSLQQSSEKHPVYYLEYDKSVISESRLEQYKDEEVAAKVTLVGPHRDDIVFHHQSSSGKEVVTAAYGSRGEQRLAVLWLKLAELTFVTEMAKDRPVLLLDDIFSEFDQKHAELVMSIVEHYQTIITSADEDIIRKLTQGDPQTTVIHLPFE